MMVRDGYSEFLWTPVVFLHSIDLFIFAAFFRAIVFPILIAFLDQGTLIRYCSLDYSITDSRYSGQLSDPCSLFAYLFDD